MLSQAKINNLHAELYNIGIEDSGRTKRFEGAPFMQGSKLYKVHIIGAGGIGSNLAHSLCRLSSKIVVVLQDDDIFETHNLGGQYCLNNAVGTPKVFAVKEAVRQVSRDNLVADYSRAESLDLVSYDVIVLAVDNMKTRINLSKLKDFDAGSPKLFIDARMGPNGFNFYAISSLQEDWVDRYIGYRMELFTDEEADVLSCSYKQTAFIGHMLGGAITQVITNFMCNDLGLPFTVPYHTNFFGPLMLFEVDDKRFKENTKTIDCNGCTVQELVDSARCNRPEESETF